MGLICYFFTTNNIGEPVCFQYYRINIHLLKGKMYVYILASVRDDIQFPFKEGEKVNVSIKGKGLIIYKEK